MKVTNEELCLIDNMLFFPEAFNLTDEAIDVLKGLFDKLEKCEHDS